MSASDTHVILPGATLGVLGGGQLGRMFVQEAQAMGYFTAVLDADPTSPAGLVSHHHIRTGYEDAQGLAEMARLCAAVTTEFENVPAAALDLLAQTRRVSPAGSAVAIAQDRAAEKAHFVRCGVPVATFAIGAAGAANAALFAVALLANHDPALRQKLETFRAEQTAAARAMTLPPVAA